MATQIHAFGPNGELSPGAEAALEGLGGGGGGATSLDGLTDVDTSGKTTGHVLKYDGSKWIAGAQSAGTVTSTDITDSTSVGRSVLTAANQSAARTAIGAGTSDLALGSTGSTAAAGNHTHTGYVPTSRTVNSKALSSNITLTAADVGAASSSHNHDGTYLPATQTINAKTGAYTLVASDAGKLVTMTLAAPADLTVPANVFTAGQRVDIADRGTARVTVVAGSGMTVNPPAGGSLVMEGRYAYASLVFVSATEADLVGLVAAP